MDWKHHITNAIVAAGAAPDDDVVEELAQHARAIYDEARAEGASADEAQARVERQIDIWCADAASLRRRSRSRTVVEPPPANARHLAGALHDLRYAARLLARRPAAALVAIVTMALGIGATTVLFSVAWGVLFKPLPWPDADRLVRLSETRQGSTRRLPPLLTNGTYLAWRTGAATIEEIGGWTTDTVTMAAGGSPQRVRIAAVTPSVFPLVRAQAALGSVFTTDATPQDVVVSYGLWQQLLGGDPSALGRSVMLDGEPRTIVAVMPRSFEFPDKETRAWVPFRVRPVVGENNSRTISIFRAMARLKPGVTAAQASAEATARARSAPNPLLTAVAVFGSQGPAEVTARGALDDMTREVRQPLLVFLFAVGLLLATATANVASVQLARAATRRREMAIRSALGAAGSRLPRQLLIEKLLVGMSGGLLGGLGAFWLHRGLPRLLPADFPRVMDVALDLRVLAFAFAISVVSSVAFGLMPALSARRLNLVEALTEDSLAPVGASGRTRTARVRALIMAGQVAVASVLLIGASLLIRSFVSLLNVDRGYDVTNVLTAQIPMGARDFTPTRRAQMLERLLDRIRSLPGVSEVAFTTVLPLTPIDRLMAFTMPASTATGERAQIQAGIRTVSPSYFAALGMRIVEGRSLSDTDTATSRPVVLVNRAFARRYLDNQAIGRELPAGLDPSRTEQLWQIVGVVDDVRMRNVTDPPQPEVFVSYRQLKNGILPVDPTIVVRASTDPHGLTPRIRDLLREQDSSLVLDSVLTMDERLLQNLARPRLYAIMLGAFAVFALTIAAVGLFGALSYGVAQRSREIAVRSALGARPSQILQMVVRQGLTIAVAGILVGMVAAVALARSMATFLYGVTPHDALTFVTVPLLLLVVTTVACFIPARRAARLDPLRVLKAG